MKWSWKMGEFLGIGVFVHVTFLLLIAWIAVGRWVTGSMASAVTGVVFILALFACVILHEYGHALMARRYGIKTRDITLLPIGGVARLERMPEEPRQEMWVALAGPAVNLAIAAAIGAGLYFTGEGFSWRDLGVRSESFLRDLMAVNLFLVAFNLLPAFPMDGGRVLRALLATRMHYTRATQIAGMLGQGMALLFGFLGIFGNPMLLFIALFVWIGAEQETAMVQMKSSLGGIPVSQAMVTDFRTLPAEESLRHAASMIIRGSQTDFPVLENGRLAGILTRGDLVKALAERGMDARIGTAMQTDFLIVDTHEMLESVFRKLMERECHTSPVTEHGRVVGLLTMENLGEFLMIQAAVAGKTVGLTDVVTGALLDPTRTRAA